MTHPSLRRRLLPWGSACALLLSLSVGCPTTTPDDDDDDSSNTTGDFTYDDSDGDTIMDVHEGLVDFDGDGDPNLEDTDSDGDLIPDAIEAGDSDPLTLPADSDEDGQPDFIDIDSDNNGIADSQEAVDPANPRDSDGDGVADFADLDNDGDGISDVVEIGLNPTVPSDSDSDGVPDYLDDDSDNDGVRDEYEAGTGPFNPNPRDTDGDGIPDYLDDDSDGDGYGDSTEYNGDENGEPRDLDDDGVYDFIDTDADGDGILDNEETFTDPFNPDSDNDGFTDGAEILGGSDPNNPIDVPEGVYVVVEERSTVEEAFTFETELDVGDVLFVLDTTCSMSSTLNTMATNFSNVVTQVSASLTNVAFGVASFDDYPTSGFGSPPDKPFLLGQQITTETVPVQSALSALSIHNGSDGPESTHEAVFQAASGLGYDQNCNGAYDSGEDVPPFIPFPGDRFSGAVSGVFDPTTVGGGDIGGGGFRPYSLPIIVYVTDNILRDPETGDAAPPACSQPAGSFMASDAVNAIGGKLIGVNVSSNSTVLNQMNALADYTNSQVDLDGDGLVDDNLVFSGTSSILVNSISQGIAALVETGEFDVTLEVPNDDFGFVTAIEPAEGYPDVPAGTNLTFTLFFAGVQAATTDDQLFRLDLLVIGDGATLLDELQILVVVPGTG